ncbi:MAG: hypothetical protein IKS07_05405 [Lachnospiraceae bacterium]|nr:hypothetical protein [Lachnospiraceae bacterium]
MKEQLYTIPLNDAVAANDECPFCYIERSLEQDLLDFCLGSGSSYMESDIRDLTDRAGFCRRHFKAMFDYGNTLGNGWILKTHSRRMIEAFSKEAEKMRPGKKGLRIFAKKDADSANSLTAWIRERESSCYICEEYEKTYERYLATFFYLWKGDDAFREKIRSGKGFCLPHLADLCDGADAELSGSDLEEFYETVLPLTKDNLVRVHEDIAWLIEKFDYRNKDADWKNSRDAIQRCMQKLKGGYPADAPYRQSK